MHRVVQVLDEHLPVAVVQEAKAAAGELELALRRSVGEVVDGGEGLAEIIAEADAVLGQARKYKSAIGLDVLDHRQAEAFVLECRALVAFFERNVDERAVGPVRPSVIGTAERL